MNDTPACVSQRHLQPTVCAAYESINTQISLRATSRLTYNGGFCDMN
jgi:hypothetical protein